MNSVWYKQASCNFFKKSFSTSEILLKSHYDALGVHPKCTQNDIKVAYYKLSKIYHPDKNKGSETAADKFRDITTAYEVLGNLKTRKLYDKGILHNPDIRNNQDMDSQTTDLYKHAKFYHSRNMPHHRTSNRTTDKQTAYNFDEWTRAHYGRVFSRRTAAKARYGSSPEENFRMKEDDRESGMYKVGFAATLLAAFFFYITYLPAYDIRTKHTRKNE